jgi:hypothetical protein
VVQFLTIPHGESHSTSSYQSALQMHWRSCSSSTTFNAQKKLISAPEKSSNNWIWSGFFIFVPMSVCIILGLQWGGIMYDWSNARVIVLLTLAGILALCFLYSQYRAGDNGMFPLRLLCQRSGALGAIFTFCMPASLFVAGYYVSEPSKLWQISLLLTLGDSFRYTFKQFETLLH